MRVKTIISNWSVTEREGETYATYEVGVGGISEIIENAAKGEGDKWNWIVKYTDGSIIRIFNIDSVKYFKQTPRT